MFTFVRGDPVVGELLDLEEPVEDVLVLESI
jgi:hypothetical protein